MPGFRDAAEFIDIPSLLNGYFFDHSAFAVVASEYARNMMRIQSLGRLPILLTGTTWAHATYDMVARNELLLGHNDPRLDPDAKLFDRDLLIHKEHRRMKLQREWFERSKKEGEKSGMDVGESMLAYFSSYENAELFEGLSAVLIGMISGMWTSFEVMAEELQRESIKERPLLGSNWTKDQRNESGNRSIKKIRALYNNTFRQDAADIHKTIGDERIEGLALTRNLLIHRHGEIDEEFNKRRGASIPSLSCFDAFQLHDQIKITGTVVHHLISPMPVIGLDLIRHVDHWITNHP